MANTSILAAFERFWQHIVVALGNKADASHTHNEATQSDSGLMSAEDKIQLDYGGIPIVITEGDGATYTVTVNGITSLTIGVKITIIPHVTSTTTAPKLNVNGLGEKTIRMPVTYNTSLTSAGVVSGWLLANKPVTVQWNGTYWITVDLARTSAQYLSGAVPIANGGTGATDAATARANLEVTLENLGFPAYTSSDEDKFLRIVNGAPAWATVPSAEEVGF